MQQILETIGASALFNGLPADQLAAVADIAIKTQHRKGDVVFSEGEAGNGFYIIASGQVKIFKVSVDGKEQILHIFGPGEPFGEVPVFTGRPFPASAQVITAATLIFFPKAAFVDLISDHPYLALNMLGVLSMRLRQFTVQIENLSLKEVPARLASYLVYLAEEQGDRSLVKLAISKGQLASLLGTIPETLSRIFARMTAQNLIRVSGREIRLRDYGQLEDLAEFGMKTE